MKDKSTHSYIAKERYPQQIIALAKYRIKINGKKQQRRQKHRTNELPRGGKPDKNAIPDKRAHTGYRNQEAPKAEIQSPIHDRAVGSKHFKNEPQTTAIRQTKQTHDTEPPQEQCPNALTQHGWVTGTEIFSDQRLTGIRETVHEICKHKEQLHYQGIDGESEISAPSTCRRKKSRYREQANAPQENITVYPEKLAHTVARENAFNQREIQILTIFSNEQRHAHRKTEILGNKRADRNPDKAEPETKDRKQTHDHIHDIHGNGNIHGEARILHSYVPPFNGIRTKQSRRTPYTYIIIRRSKCGNLVRRRQHEQ